LVLSAALLVRKPGKLLRRERRRERERRRRELMRARPSTHPPLPLRIWSERTIWRM
jgi:hypothetical protein